ncbi:MAG: chorismate mutase [Actinobacteria bacterium]|jgi:chorismate mutase|nr:chorismate mutase [Actinomycetota bacterium]
MSVRAIRGATQIERDDPALMQEAVTELVAQILQSNNLQIKDLISIIFTATQDLVSDFPAAAARSMGLGEVPLLCAVEIAVPGSLPRTIRALLHCESDRTPSQISHIYLRGTSVLRKDLAQ